MYRSLDRKVCNTTNVICVLRDREDTHVDLVLDAARAAGETRGAPTRLHVVAGSEGRVAPEWFDTTIAVRRAEGVVEEPRADVVAEDALGVEWEWEDNPEVTLVVVDSLARGGRALQPSQSPGSPSRS